MIVRNLYLCLFTTAVMLSCKKEDTNGNNNNNIVAAASYNNVAYGADALQKMDVYLPAGRSKDSTKVMVLIHGGAWASGDKADFAPFIDSLKRRLPDYAIFNINYRLSGLGANVFPTQETDTRAAVEFIFSKRAEYLISDNFSMLGASAGAHLALLQAYKYSVPVKAKVVVDFFGPTNLNDLYNNPGVVPQSTIEAIVGATPVSNPALYFQSSPINYATGSAACPTIILQGSADLLVNATSQSFALKNKLELEGVPVQYVEYAGAGHGDWNTATFSDAFNKIQAFVNLYNP
ncbi:MAG TPA: alpha/beta hydrolase [Ferruginibacter sp.]|nr:alpha/beta hydrolase [Ferruginibacter sp.]HPH92767.1 alpha/beta hydrolase [Ferruginibacter sp.]